MIQIVLTILAWSRGWKAWALLPIGICLIGGFALGYFYGLVGLQTENLETLGIVMDLTSMVVLAGMIVKGRKSPVSKQSVVEMPDSMAHHREELPIIQ